MTAHTGRLVMLGIAVVGAAAIGLGVGEVALSPTEVWEALVGGAGESNRTQAEAVVWSIRMPRVVGGVLVGLGLGAGAGALQAYYRNPLADPYLLGTSSAAGVGAVVGLVLLPAAAPAGLVTALAAVGAAGFGVGTRRLVSSDHDSTRLVLVGLTLGIALLAWTVMVVFVADSPRLPTFTYFIFGGLATSTWSAVWPSAVIVTIGGAALLRRWRELDLLGLGEAEAHHLGLDVPRTAALVLGTSGAITGATVALGGVIGFVGLLAPRVARRALGPSARWVIPGAALAGAALVLGADIAARVLAGPVEVPIGIVTAAVGGPVLAWLIARRP